MNSLTGMGVILALVALPSGHSLWRLALIMLAIFLGALGIATDVFRQR